MSKYSVTMYAVCRTTVEVEADSQEEAALKAEKDNDLFELEWVYAEELEDALVDEEGDEEYERSTWYTYTPDGGVALKGDSECGGQ